MQRKSLLIAHDRVLATPLTQIQGSLTAQLGRVLEYLSIPQFPQAPIDKQKRHPLKYSEFSEHESFLVWEEFPSPYIPTRFKKGAPSSQRLESRELSCKIGAFSGALVSLAHPGSGGSLGVR